MDWDAVGAIAEVVGAIGVVVSLTYLGIQVRQNTRSQKAQSYQDLVMSVAELAASIGTNPSSSRIFWTGLSKPEALTAEETGQFSLLLISFFRRYENVFHQNQKIGLDKEDWEEWGYNMCRIFWLPGTQQWWPTWRNTYNAEFCKFLENSTPPALEEGLQSSAQNWSGQQ